jgi:single-strand DNA-binding protein
MQHVTISGNIGSDAVTRQTQRGDKVTAFSLGVRQGYGENQSTNWYRCNVWGDRGEKIAQYLLKGVKAFVVGELSIGSYEGKAQYDVRVNEVEWERRQAGEQRREPDGRQGAPISPFDSNLDDDVPFGTCDPAYEPGFRRQRII